jgi:hypothetical protein
MGSLEKVFGKPSAVILAHARKIAIAGLKKPA